MIIDPNIDSEELSREIEKQPPYPNPPPRQSPEAHKTHWLSVCLIFGVTWLFAALCALVCLVAAHAVQKWHPSFLTLTAIFGAALSAAMVAIYQINLRS